MKNKVISKLPLILKAKKLTVSQFCHDTGISRSQYYDHTVYNQDFTLGNALKIAKYLNFSVEDIWQLDLENHDTQ